LESLCRGRFVNNLLEKGVLMEKIALMKRVALILCVLPLIFSSCGKQEEPKVIKVAVSPTSPPNMFEENGTFKGLDLEIFEGFCKAKGYQYKITAYDWQGMLGAVIGGQADVAFSAISITDQRKEKMDFSQAYMDNTWNLVSMKAKNIVIKDLAELKKYSIGYPRGMAYSTFIKDNLEPKGVYRLSDVKMYPTYNEVLADLQNGNLDLAFLDGTVASVYKKKISVQDSYVFSGFDTLGFAFPKGSKLRVEFDEYLKEGLGEEGLKAIIKKYME
jgi:polar amino acid transport system substrate-binding protein